MSGRTGAAPTAGGQAGTVIDYCGARLFIPQGHFDETHMLAGGTPEPHVMATLRAFVPRGATVIDVGANIGTHSLALAELVGPGGRVYAVEADIDNAAALRTSLRLSGIDTVHLLPVAAAETAGTVRLLATGASNSVFAAHAPEAAAKLAAAVPLDALIRERVDFIKLDIEGAELLAVRGMTSIIDYARPLILSEFSPAYIAHALGADRAREYLQFFLDRRYVCDVVDTDGRRQRSGSIDETLEHHAAALRDFGWNHIELLFTPAEFRTERLLAAPAGGPAPPLRLVEPVPIPPGMAARPADDAAADGPAADGYVAPAFLSAPPADAALAWTFAPPTLDRPAWQLCTAAQMESDTYATVVRSLGLDPAAKHRKVWEFAYIMAALRAHGLLAGGTRGLGFGTGEEPIPSALAALGVTVLASDAPADTAGSPGWAESHQWAASRDALWHAALVPRDTFERNVDFRAVDMNAIPPDLAGFDFCWSACCLEHLGGLRAGLDFIHRSLDTLRPGGVAVHTTEFNLGSDEETIDEPGLCIYRKQDIERLAAELTAAGHTVAPINLWPGDTPVDRHIDLPPYGQPHLKLRLLGQCTTSIGLVVRRAG